MFINGKEFSEKVKIEDIKNIKRLRRIKMLKIHYLKNRHTDGRYICGKIAYSEFKTRYTDHKNRVTCKNCLKIIILIQQLKVYHLLIHQVWK